MDCIGDEIEAAPNAFFNSGRGLCSYPGICWATAPGALFEVGFKVIQLLLGQIFVARPFAGLVELVLEFENLFPVTLQSGFFLRKIAEGLPTWKIIRYLIRMNDALRDSGAKLVKNLTPIERLKHPASILNHIRPLQHVVYLRLHGVKQLVVFKECFDRCLIVSIEFDLESFQLGGIGQNCRGSQFHQRIICALIHLVAALLIFFGRNEPLPALDVLIESRLLSHPKMVRCAHHSTNRTPFLSEQTG